MCGHLKIVFFGFEKRGHCSRLGLPFELPHLVCKARCMVRGAGPASPRRSLTRIHSLDSNRRVTADGEAKAVLPPRDGDLGHSPAQLLPEATRLLPLLQRREAHRPYPRATLLSKGAGAKKEAGQLLPFLSWPRRLEHWFVGQAGRLGTQEVKPG